jgi:hypothetical protein
MKCTAAVIIALLLPAAVLADGLQCGLRLDARSSLQWTGSRLLLESGNRYVVDLQVGEIRDVWLGAAAGVFGVSSSEGIGVVIGRKVALGGHLLSERAIVRSARPDTLWACEVAGSTSGTKCLEWRASGKSRVLFELPDHSMIDFDVTRKGTIDLLTATHVLVISGPTTMERLQLPDSARGGLRVFADGDEGAIVVYARGGLSRYSAAEKRWTSAPFDAQSSALVRHVLSRRIRIEQRLAIPSQRKPTDDHNGGPVGDRAGR